MTQPGASQHADPAAGGPREAEVPARYAGEWTLFLDWCSATSRTALPAEPSDVEAFLVDCPAAPATLARRLSAIAAAHRAAGLPPPKRTDPVRDAGRGRPVRPVRQPIDPDQLGEALRVLPSHGWTAGWFGRRDRALLVLTGAGLPYRTIAQLTVGDIKVRDGLASVSAGDANTFVPGDEDPVSCRPCALVRWMRTLDFAITRLNSTRSIAAALTRAAPLTGDSNHLCRSTRSQISATSRSAPLLPPIDQWGHLSGIGASLTAASLSHLARSSAVGPLPAHRDATASQPTAEYQLRQQPSADGAAVVAYSSAHWRTGIETRQRALDQMRSLDRIFDDFDMRAAELERRTLELLAKT